jgi:hypothetical protein
MAIKTTKQTDDIFAAVENLIVVLPSAGQQGVATILDHRMHRVAWTDRSELVDELRRVLRETVAAPTPTLPSDLREQMENILRVIDDS